MSLWSCNNFLKKCFKNIPFCFQYEVEFLNTLGKKVQKNED